MSVFAGCAAPNVPNEGPESVPSADALGETDGDDSTEDEQGDSSSDGASLRPLRLVRIGGIWCDTRTGKCFP
jgi:hypothetical protein